MRKQPNFYKLNNKELRKLYKTQCSPCVSSPNDCKGNPKLAEQFRCSYFCNGLTFVEIEQ